MQKVFQRKVHEEEDRKQPTGLTSSNSFQWIHNFCWFGWTVIGTFQIIHLYGKKDCIWFGCLLIWWSNLNDLRIHPWFVKWFVKCSRQKKRKKKREERRERRKSSCTRKSWTSHSNRERELDLGRDSNQNKKRTHQVSRQELILNDWQWFLTRIVWSRDHHQNHLQNQALLWKLPKIFTVK